MTEREEALVRTFLVQILAFLCVGDREGIFPEDAVNVPRNEENATKYCNARTRSGRRRCVIERSWPRNWRI